LHSKNKQLKEYTEQNSTFFKFDIFAPFHEIRHFVSSRKGGVSKGVYEGLNLGFGTEDNAEDVLENRYILAEALGIPLDWFVLPRQTHSANVVKVDYSHRGLGTVDRDSAIANTDALITNCKNLFISIQVADCVPILLLDPVNSAIAAIHAGWRGTAANIVMQTIEVMQHEFGTIPVDLIAGIGPSIGACCYEVGEEVTKSFNNHIDNSILIKNNGSIHLDLWKANQLQLIRAGVSESNIEIAGLCTKCNHHLFFSSREGKGNTGRFVAGIMLQ
jgi:polyphenol oxidase